MTKLFHGQSLKNFLLCGCTVSLIFFLVSCSTPRRIPAGSLRLAQVVEIANRDEIVQLKELYEAIRASGFNDSEIVDGSVVVARIYCCGGLTENTSSEKVNALILYVPKGLNISLGDIVEVKSGRPPEKGDAGMMNVVTRLVQKNGANYAPCWWDPKDDRLWLRVLYCDWMPKEGWIKQEGINPAWFKPATSGLPSN